MGGSRWRVPPLTFVLLFPLCGECGDDDDQIAAAVTFLPRNSQGTISRWLAGPLIRRRWRLVHKTRAARPRKKYSELTFQLEFYYKVENLGAI